MEREFGDSELFCPDTDGIVEVAEDQRKRLKFGRGGVLIDLISDSMLIACVGHFQCQECLFLI